MLANFDITPYFHTWITTHLLHTLDEANSVFLQKHEKNIWKILIPLKNTDPFWDNPHHPQPQIKILQSPLLRSSADFEKTTRRGR